MTVRFHGTLHDDLRFEVEVMKNDEWHHLFTINLLPVMRLIGRRRKR